MKPIYVDNNATTRVADEVFAVMQPYFCEEYGNPSSMHSVGGRVSPKLKEARNQLQTCSGLAPTKSYLPVAGPKAIILRFMPPWQPTPENTISLPAG